ncbi:hypothetical protein P3T76_008725 [Phytophthora citrophthora]|uniref:PX domain-containing protein n=1 Tax=Phytophthora citrophthora TaxID=4793 RepID=A0AAD9GIX1_9STRA|nr:hypothetical protein P3T76_008725 [Phytophthora citrophthora]
MNYHKATQSLATCSSPGNQKLSKVTAIQPQRGLAISGVSQASTSSVWYYRVDVSVYEHGLRTTFISDEEVDTSCGDDDEDEPQTIDVEHYSISRRYSDFQQLYERIRSVVVFVDGSAIAMPPFPAKEKISPALIGLVRRVSSSNIVVADRRAKFENLLQWIENHPVARDCKAFVDFLGKPPQSHSGYVSLSEYTSPDWLSSLHQATKEMGSRRRRHSSSSARLRRAYSSSTSLASLHNRPTSLDRCVSAPCDELLDTETFYSRIDRKVCLVLRQHPRTKQCRFAVWFR